MKQLVNDFLKANLKVNNKNDYQHKLGQIYETNWHQKSNNINKYDHKQNDINRANAT